MIENTFKLGKKIEQMQKLVSRNSYTLEIYQRVNEIVGFTPKILIALNRFDQASDDEQRLIEKAKIIQLKMDFINLRDNLDNAFPSR